MSGERKKARKRHVEKLKSALIKTASEYWVENSELDADAVVEALGKAMVSMAEKSGLVEEAADYLDYLAVREAQRSVPDDFDA